MDLNSLENIRLLRNCIAIEIQKIQDSDHSESLEMQNKINNYTNLFHLLIRADAKNVLQSQIGDLAKLGAYMLSTPPEEILKKYENIVKQSMLDTNTYDEKKFNRFKDAFYADFKESKKEQQQSCPNIDGNLTSTMNDFQKLFKNQKSCNMSPSQFRDFSAQFKNLVSTFGKDKFQQYFKPFGQTVTDMQISYDTDRKSVV